MLQNTRLFEFLDDLFYSGLIQINGKDVSMISQIDRGEKKKKGYGLPTFWVLKYTNACNLRCAYCYSYDKNLTKRVAIPNEYVYKISELIGETEDENILSLCFHGGEPLTRFKDIVECVKHLDTVRHGDIEYTIQTNGTLLTPAIAKFLKEHDFGVGISVDGYNESTNRLRPFANHYSSINATLNAIKNCINVGITPGVISVLTKNNYLQVIEIMEDLSKRGVKSFHFIHFLPSGRGEHKEKDFSVPIKELIETRKRMLLYINDTNAKLDPKHHISERFTRNIIKRLTNIGDISYMCAKSPCGAGREMLALTYDGSIYPCDDFCGNEDFRIGNVNEIVNLRETLAKSRAVYYCQNHCVENIPKCKSCLYKKICISHCCSDSYYYTGSFNSPHSSCEFVQSFIPIVIDLIHDGRIQVENLVH